MFFWYNVLIIMLIYFNFNSIEKGFIGTPDTCGGPFFILLGSAKSGSLRIQSIKLTS